MNEKTTFTFRVRDKGGTSGGKTLSNRVPNFDLATFLKSPNAEQFIEKAYGASVKKIMREINEHKNGSLESDLDSFEAVITRSLTFTQAEIGEWIKSRDFKKVKDSKNILKAKEFCESELPKLAARNHTFNKEDSERLATMFVAQLADNPDPVAEFLFSVLTLPKTTSVITLDDV